MKTFEERYTAWVDGKLQGPELASFERELENRPAADADREGAMRLGRLLRSHAAPALRNPDFFNHQLLARIDRDVAGAQGTGATTRSLMIWPWLRLALTGVAAVALGWGIARVSYPIPDERPQGVQTNSSGYIAQIIDPKPLEPGVSASVIEDGEDNLTVLWLDGLEYLPASYELQ